MKKTVTISISIPVAVDNELESMSEELNVSKSALATAILSIVFKWNKAKEILKNGI